MSLRNRTILGLALLPALVLSIREVLRRGIENVESHIEANRPAKVYPDYSGTEIPPNIAPLNLKILEPGRKFCLRLSADAGAPFEVFSIDGNIRIQTDKWRHLLEANTGRQLKMDIYTRAEGSWVHFDAVRIGIAVEPIDPYVVYRYIPPIYTRWYQMSLRQRDLRNFDERVIFDNQRSLDHDGKNVTGACVNCHTFPNNHTDHILLHMRRVRSRQIAAMALVLGQRATLVDTRKGSSAAAAYSAWHPSGNLVAFSRNRLTQLFHTAGVETREVVDRNSDLGFYRLDTGEVFTIPEVSRPDRLETFPSWSPDGRYLYFCSAPLLWREDQNVQLLYAKVQYDLQRIAYDYAANRWGQVETVVAAGWLGKSISLPRISPDGRFLMFCAHDHGSFPIYQPSSDLYLLDLSQIESPPRPHAMPPGSTPPAIVKASLRSLDEINSERSESYHSWSSNARWVIFTSKREDGMFARLYIAHLRADGRFGRPFVMPQQDPEFYGRCLLTYNLPELLAEPVTVSATEMARAMNSMDDHPQSISPAGSAHAPAELPWQPGN
jgi:hypothetical protein